jgi:hypothetical protein
MRCMVETQYDAACCGSTASLQFHTSYFISPCVAWWRRSTTQRAPARLRLYNFTLHTSYHHALHGGDAVRRSVLRLDCVSTISYFILRITMRCMVETQYDAACCGSTASLQFHTSHFVSPCVAWWRRSTTQRAAARLRLYNFILHTSYYHALHGGDAVRRSVLRLDCVSTISYFILRITMRCMVETQYDAACSGSTASLQFHTSYFVLPCVAWWRRSTTQRAPARLRLYNFILHTSYHHALHGGDAVRRSVLRLDCVSTISYFILRITMRCMVETQYDAACCGSTASLQFHTSYFVSPCVAWWRRSTTQRAPARLRLYNFILHTSYHHALHGGDAVRRSVLRLDCVSTISYFILRITMRCMVETQYDAACCGSTASLQFHTSYFVSPCVAWWRRSTTQRAAVRLRLYNFILHTSYHHALHGGDAVRRSVFRFDCVSTISHFILRITMRCMVETQYDAACCGSTASLQFHTSYFISPCVAWWRRSTTQRAAARLRLYNFTLHTSYFILHTSIRVYGSGWPVPGRRSRFG